jgi:hypothetical protein
MYGWQQDEEGVNGREERERESIIIAAMGGGRNHHGVLLERNCRKYTTHKTSHETILLLSLSSSFSLCVLCVGAAASQQHSSRMTTFPLQNPIKKQLHALYTNHTMCDRGLPSFEEP